MTVAKADAFSSRLAADRGRIRRQIAAVIPEDERMILKSRIRAREFHTPSTSAIASKQPKPTAPDLVWRLL